MQRSTERWGGGVQGAGPATLLQSNGSKGFMTSDPLRDPLQIGGTVTKRGWTNTNDTNLCEFFNHGFTTMKTDEADFE